MHQRRATAGGSAQSQDPLFQTNNALASNFFTNNGGLPTEPGLQGIDYFVTQLIDYFLNPQPTYSNGMQLSTGIAPLPLEGGAAELLGLGDLTVAEGADVALAGGGDLTRVGRWMSPQEFDIMSDTGTVVEGGGGRTYVVNPADLAAYERGSRLCVCGI